MGTGNGASCSNPWTKTQINSFNTITSSAKIGKYTDNNCTWTGFVQYVAAKKITLQQGFKVSDGAYFDAQIDNQDQSIDASGDYSWLKECQECSYPATIANVIETLDNCPCPYLSTNCSATFTPVLDQPLNCYHNLNGGYYIWTLTDPNGNVSSPVTEYSYSFSTTGGGSNPCWNNGCTYYLNLKYFQGSTMLSEKNLEIVVRPHAGTPNNPCDEKVALDTNDASKTNNNQQEIISVYPNPTDGIFTVSDTKTDEIFSVEVSNVLGSIVFSGNNFNNKVQIDLSSQAKGVYFVKTIIQGKTEQETKIIYQ